MRCDRPRGMFLQWCSARFSAEVVGGNAVSSTAKKVLLALANSLDQFPKRWRNIATRYRIAVDYTNDLPFERRVCSRGELAALRRRITYHSPARYACVFVFGPTCYCWRSYTASSHGIDDKDTQSIRMHRVCVCDGLVQQRWIIHATAPSTRDLRCRRRATCVGKGRAHSES